MGESGNEIYEGSVFILGFFLYLFVYFLFLACWLLSFLALVPSSGGPLVPWSSGPVVLWSRGPLVLWSCGKEGRKEGTKEGRKEGRKEGMKHVSSDPRDPCDCRLC